MARVEVALSVSLDGFFARPDGALDWHRVDDELHSAFNEHSATLSAFLTGRVMYELMEDYWPTADEDPDASEPEVEFAQIWRDTPKVVYSRTLASVGPNATLVRDVVPAEVRALPGTVGVGGAALAAAFLERGLVDEYRLHVHPVVLGEGRPLFASPVSLELLETKAFGNGVVMLRYRPQA